FFAVSFTVSILYLFKAGSERRFPKSSGDSGGVLPASSVLDEIGYKTIAIGFPLLTIGIVTGAFWANVAWGTYWSWDPKETWSLIVWLIYAAYLHARITRGWRGRKAAILSIVGFAATVFCYLGVNLILSGLHSYGGAS
ncbi:MAG: c-type cytochrome biogenesis protein CcsB, partial [Deltaproteobacteria bacterium]|nr:c-type cytochrome biogenesis protein CcsB [Deltaproteobacteria bacterium]